jgi:probable rRNA maturation factor
MIFQVSLTKNIRKSYQPKLNQVKSYIRNSLVKDFGVINIDVVIVSAKVSRELNLKYRERDYPTNVISLEDRSTREEFNILQGELILCDEIIVNEAHLNYEPVVSNHPCIEAHYAHMIVHGILHLQGFDHIRDDEATHMEGLEVQILKRLGFDNPYKNVKNT